MKKTVPSTLSSLLKLINLRQNFSLIGWLVVQLVFLTLVATLPVQAQLSDPKTRGATVSATMPDIIPPSAPILISPENNATLSINRPQFVWQESTDNVQMSHYQLHINGELVVNNLAAAGNYPMYTLRYSAVLGYYYLDVLFDIDQGNNTWKIVAVDEVGLTTSSATWSFLIDSIAPHFVLTQIGEVEVSISAQDGSTIPSSPISLSANEPTLVAYGEANSLVQLTVKIPGQDDLFIESRIDSSGNWSYTLPILPRDKIITLNFVIIDQVMHISALEGVQIIIPSKVVVIPRVTVLPTPTPTLKPGEPTPVVTPPVEPKPEPEPKPQEPIKIPLLPPKEMVYEVFRQLTPTPIWRVATRPWFVRLISWLGPWLVALIVSWPVGLATILLARGFGNLISITHLKSIWRSLGLLPWSQHQGWVFDSAVHQLALNHSEQPLLGVPFAHVTAISQSEPEGFPPYYHSVLTDYQGLYPIMELPLKSYKLAVTHRDYRCPTALDRHPYAQLIDFYKADEVEVSLEAKSLSLQIPVDSDLLGSKELSARMVDKLAKVKQQLWSRLTRFQVWLAKLIIFKHLFVLANLLTACGVILFYPSVINIAALVLYLVFGFYCVLSESLFANLKGLVVDKDGHIAVGVMVRLEAVDGSQPTVATLTNQQGRFAFSFKKGEYLLSAKFPNSSPLTREDLENRLEIANWWEQHRVVLGTRREMGAIESTS